MFRVLLLISSIFLLFVNVKTQTCIWETTSHTYDFNPARKNDTNYYYFDTSESLLYIYNLCGPLNPVNQTICPCCTNLDNYTGFTMDTNSSCDAWGSTNYNETWDYLDVNNTNMGVSLTYRIMQNNKTSRVMTYNAFCQESEHFSIISTFELGTTPPSIHINVASDMACLEPTPSPEPSPTPDPSLCKTIFANDLYNLQTLKNNYYFFDGFRNLNFWIGVCQNVTNATNCTCCVDNEFTGWMMNESGSCTSLGQLNTSSYSYLPGSNDSSDGIALYYQVQSGQTVSHSLRIDFVCEPSIITPVLLDVYENDHLTPPRTEVTFVTAHGCPLNPISPCPTISPCVSCSPCPTASPCPTNSPCPSCSPFPSYSPCPSSSPCPSNSPCPTTTPCPTCPPFPSYSPCPSSSPCPLAASSSPTGVKGSYVFLFVTMGASVTFMAGWFIRKYKTSRQQYNNL